MESTEKKRVLVEIKINAPINNVWKYWTTPDDIIKWNNASEDWHTPKAENDLCVNGQFLYRMEAKDGSFRFDFFGVYNVVITNKLIEYTLGDGRNVKVVFNSINNVTEIVETFEAESVNPLEMQRAGWLAILENFKKYVELNNR